MSNGSRTRSGQEKVRQWCHRAIDKVAELSEENRLKGAERVLEKASSDSVRQKLVELSISESDEITAAFVRAAVRTGSVQMARAAADLLMDIKSADSARAVIEDCLESDDLSVKRRAVEAIETLQDPRALDLLGRALESEEDGVRRAATATFGLMVGSKYHSLSDMLLDRLEDPDSDLFRAIVESEDVSLRREVAQSLGFARTDRVLPLLQKLTNDEDIQTRQEAVLALAANTSEKTDALLRGKLTDADDMVAATVLDALAAQYGRDSSKMLGALKEALNHPDSRVRRHAVLMLNQYDAPEVKDLLQEAAQDEDFEVQRSANSLLRSKGSQAGLPTLREGAGKREMGEDALNIWEAGNIGIESETARAKSMMEARGVASAQDVVPVLERAAIEGSTSNRQHAVTELLELQDVADSPALRRALYDSDESIRSRAASALDRTRDAGLLTEVLQNHPDPSVRRRAVDALMDNPSGYTRGGQARRQLTFSSERSEGMVLFSYFLEALSDYDEGVRQMACRAIGQFVEFNCPIPVPTTVRHLGELTEDESLSSLIQDTAQELIEQIEDADLSEPLINTMDGILDWRGKLLRQARAIQPNGEGSCTISQDLGVDPQDLPKKWQDELGLSPERAEAASAAYEAGEALEPEVAAALQDGIYQALRACLQAVHHSSRALRLIGESAWREQAQEWAQALGSEPSREGGEDDNRRLQLRRLRQQARCAALAAAQTLKDDTDFSELERIAEQAEDDWVRLAALTARAEVADDPTAWIDRLGSLIQQHAEEEDFLQPLARAAALLLQEGHADVIPTVETVLARADTDFRCDLIQLVMTAAQEDGSADALRNHLAGRKLNELSALGLGLGLMGGSGSMEGIQRPDELSETDDPELLCAFHALGAMQNCEEDAQALKNLLRNGSAQERYCAASYLGLARVQSALPVWASVSDQVDSGWPLRTLNAAMLVRRGHRLGMRWFAKNAEQRKGAEKPPMAIQLARAIEDVLPLMLHCKTVNLGRFV